MRMAINLKYLNSSGCIPSSLIANIVLSASFPKDVHQTGTGADIATCPAMFTFSLSQSEKRSIWMIELDPDALETSRLARRFD